MSIIISKPITKADTTKPGVVFVRYVHRSRCALSAVNFRIARAKRVPVSIDHDNKH